MLNIFRPRQPDTFNFCPTFFEISIIAHHHHNHHVITIPGPLDNPNKVPYGARKCHRGPEIHTLEYLLRLPNNIYHYNHHQHYKH